MSDELKPCPFCGGEAVKEYDSDWGLVVRCLKCPAIMTESPYFGVLNPVEAWNTRAERTCKIDGTYDDEFGIYDHLSCGHVAMRQWPEKTQYCPNCGAKVVE